MSRRPGVVVPFDEPMSAREIGAALRSRRLVIDYSQEKLAEISGLERYQIANWEMGCGLLKVSRLFHAFEACGCEIKIAPSETLKALLRGRS